MQSRTHHAICIVIPITNNDKACLGVDLLYSHLRPIVPLANDIPNRKTV